jgi:hypothetical protein
VSGSELRAGWLRLQVLLAFLVPALLAGANTAAVTATALALVAAALLARVRPVPALAPVSGTRVRAWRRAEAGIERAEEPDRPGRPRPRAPGAPPAASER